MSTASWRIDERIGGFCVGIATLKFSFNIREPKIFVSGLTGKGKMGKLHSVQALKNTPER